MTGFAVVLYFDSATESRVKTLWESLYKEGVNPTLLTIGPRPHISLAVFESVDPAAIREELRTIAEDFSPLTVELSSVGTFAASEGVVFVAPVVTMDLIELHERFHRHLAELEIPSDERYKPGNWVPHCTAAIDVTDEQLPAAIEICRSSDVFVAGQLTEIGLVECEPVHELYSFPMGSDN